MKVKFLALTALAGAMVFTSCNVEDEIQENTAVLFTAGIDQAAAVGGMRASGTAWSGGDAIGIFMMDGATPIASNRQYTTVGNGTFTPATGSELYYPTDDSPVNFIAYYPYMDGAALDTPIDITIGDQSQQPSFDLLWTMADNGGAGYSKASHETTPVALTFDHKLAKLVMNCKADASVSASLDGMTVTIKGMNTKNTFNLQTGAFGVAGTEAAISPNKWDSPVATYAATYDAIILPGSYADGDVTVEFTLASTGDIFIWDVGATSFDGANEYTYAVTLTRMGVQVTGTINSWTTEGNDRGNVVAE